jgi:homoserine/homoserine lactone efflux protein
MSLEIYAAFLAATILLLVTPGPTVMLVVSYALKQGRGTALATAAGVGLGDLTALSLSLAGLGALLEVSAAAFSALKWAGAAYLVFLGIKMWRLGVGRELESTARPRSRLDLLGHAFAVTALNPKSIIFFVAFFPQFVVTGQPLWPQLFILGSTFVTLAVINAALYAVLAGSFSGLLARPSAKRALGRLSGVVLIAAGVLTALLPRA